MATSANDRAGARAILRAEILQWNPTLNLVSRQDTENQLNRLIEQCDAGFDLVAAKLPSLDLVPGGLAYADVGSGNGLPGLLWSSALLALGASGPHWLVEPRGRRAWFLARAIRIAGLPTASVVAGRWGDPLRMASTPEDMLVSLKALRLTESAVLEGLARAFKGGEGTVTLPQRLAIVRFLGPSAVSDGDLDQELQLNAAVGPWRRTTREILAGPGVRLLMTAYSRS